MNVAEEHRALIALNNAGVLLFRRHFYSEALATLTEAVAAMKSAVFDGPETERAQSAEEIKLALKNTWQRCTLLTTGTRRIPDSQFINLVVSSHDDVAAVHSLLWETLGRKVQVCVTIDPASVEEMKGDDNLQMDYGILLYNYGIANSSLAFHSPDCMAAFSLHLCCLHVLPLAETLFAKFYTRVEEDNISRNKLLVPELLLTWKIIQSSTDYQPPKLWYVRKYHELIRIVLSQQAFLRMMLPNPAAAA